MHFWKFPVKWKCHVLLVVSLGEIRVTCNVMYFVHVHTAYFQNWQRNKTTARISNCEWDSQSVHKFVESNKLQTWLKLFCFFNSKLWTNADSLELYDSGDIHTHLNPLNSVEPESSKLQTWLNNFKAWMADILILWIIALSLKIGTQRICPCNQSCLTPSSFSPTV